VHKHVVFGIATGADPADLEKSNKALYDWGVFFSNVNGAAMHQVTRAEVKEAFKVLSARTLGDLFD